MSLVSVSSSSSSSSVPGALLATKQQLVFCYSSDLLDAAQFLAKELNTPYCRCIYNGTGDLPDQIDPTAVAWLVAHGSRNNTLIGTKQKKSYDMGTLVLPWCAQVGIKDACQNNGIGAAVFVFGRDSLGTSGAVGMSS